MPRGRKRGKRGHDEGGNVDRAGSSRGRNRFFKHDDQRERERAPQHLRGREIGLWHARKSQARKLQAAVETVKTMGTIIIPPAKSQQILNYLKQLPPMKSLHLRGGNYEFVPNSDFKRTFLDTINTNIKQKLENLKELQPNPALDEQFFQNFEKQQNSPHYKSMQRIRDRLPAKKLKSEIIDMINSQQIVIISGETGCGKTTQVPQYILDDHLMNHRGSLCRIVCTQPRRISAIAVAERIADERAETLGESVGYQIRLERKLPRDRGSIVFCTTGVILKQMESNVGLDGVSHLILDEIHERDVLSDFIIAILKQILQKRSNLKVVLMSATLNAEKFASYFEVQNIISIPGFTHDVKEFYLEDALLRTGFEFANNPRVCRNEAAVEKQKEFRDYIAPHARRLEDMKLYPRSVCRELLKEASEEGMVPLAVALVKDISYKEKDTGAILVFLTGYADISKMNEQMQESGSFPRSKFLIIPLHSQMPMDQQKQIFNPPPEGIRKIILATNIAETSITIDDVVFVIDCGKIKISEFHADTYEDSLTPQWVSKANADQRRGRAGRVRPGVCYHLFSKARNMLLDAYLKPELLRKRLDDVILNLKLLQLGTAEEFLSTCLDPPEVENVRNSVEFLKRLNALDENEVLTPLGYHLARLPVSPQMGKMMLLGALFSCVNPTVDIASALDFKDAFLMPLGQEVNCRKKKRELSKDLLSDHLLYHFTMSEFESLSFSEQGSFCWEYFLSKQTMSQLVKMKTQFAEILHDLNFIEVKSVKVPSANLHSSNTSLIKAIICASLYPNVFIAYTKVTKRAQFSHFSTLDKKRLELHPRSIIERNDNIQSPFLVYYRKVRSTSDFVHDASVVQTLPLIFFGDRFKVTRENGTLYMGINDSLRFKTNEETLQIVSELRLRLNAFLELKACQPAPVNWKNDQEVGVLKAIIDLITIEDEGYDFEDFDSVIDDI